MKVQVPINGCVFDYKLSWHAAERFAERALNLTSYKASRNQGRLLKSIKKSLATLKSIEWRGDSDICFIVEDGIFVANNDELSIVTFKPPRERRT